MQKPFPDKLYHYCSYNAFTSILRNKCLWMSNALFLDDPMELKIIRKYICDFINNSQLPNVKKEEIKKIISDNDHIYIACLSKDWEIGYQWANYADNCRGIVIEFDINVISNINIPYAKYPINPTKNFFACNVLYKGINTKKIVENFITKYIQFNTHQTIWKYFLYLLRMMQFYIKGEKYYPESEYRIIYSPKDITTLSRLIKYRIFDNKKIPYIELNFPVNCVKKIIIGSENKNTIGTVKLFLANNGYDTDSIIVKKIN